MIQRGEQPMLRQAALYLATQSDADRDWVLSHLTDSEREKLQPLIAEVIGLGMHRDPAVLQSICLAGEPIAQRSPDTSLASVLAELPPFWREIAADGNHLAGEHGVSVFLEMLNHSKTGPTALRRTIINYVLAGREAPHV